MLGLVMLCPGVLVAQSTTTPRASNGPATTETYVPEPRANLLGDWGGRRERLVEKGVSFDAFWVVDALSNVAGGYAQANEAWDRVHASVDVDLGRVAHLPGLVVHARGALQRGSNLGTQYVGSLANPSSLASVHATRLDSWWLEQSLLGKRLVLRAGQFAGQDSYGVREYGASFLSAPMGYAFGNLGTVYESFDPEGTPAAEVRVIPTAHIYAKTAVLSGNRDTPLSDTSGFHFRIQNAPVFVSEAGYLVHPEASSGSSKTLGKQAPVARGSLPGTYKFGSAVNPGRFTDPQNGVQSKGNFLVYFEGAQAVYRRGRVGAEANRGLDLTVGYDWSPSDVNKQNTQVTAGARYIGLLGRRKLDTLAVGWVRTAVSDHFGIPASFVSTRAQTPGAEKVVEVSYRAVLTSWLVFQPDIQRIFRPGGLNGSPQKDATVVGFRTKVTF